MINPWLSHLRQFRQQHPDLPFKQCLIQAKHTYQGGSQYAGYIRRLEAEKKITFVEIFGDKSKPRIFRKSKNEKNDFQMSNNFSDI